MMTILTKKKHIRWLLPYLLVLVVMTILLISYWKDVQADQLLSKENEIALAMGDELSGIETSISTASSALSVSGKAMSLYSIDYDKPKILTVLRGIVSVANVNKVVICDSEGNGYDHSGKEISIGQEEYFNDIKSEFAGGGSGLVIDKAASLKEKSTMILVCGFKFSNKNPGYILASMDSLGFSEQLFIDVYSADTVAISTIGGDVIYLNGRKAEEIDENVKNMWDLLPPGMTMDIFKLNISQKNIYRNEINGYGYVIQVPFKNINGCGIALIKYEQMEMMLKDYRTRFFDLVIGMVIVSVCFILLVPFVYVLGDKIEKRIKDNKKKAVEHDMLTGLLVRASAVREINDYLSQEGERNGLAFMIALNLPDESDKDNGKTINDERIKEFAHNLTAEFRASDIIGRIANDRFIVFLKGVHDQKDVRKQADHMQIFLHDSRIVEGEKVLTANAGGALCPENGKDFFEIFSSSQEALEKSKNDGPGKLVFK